MIMLSIQSGIAKYHCLYTQGAVKRRALFLTHPVYFTKDFLQNKLLSCLPKNYSTKNYNDNITGSNKTMTTLRRVHCREKTQITT